MAVSGVSDTADLYYQSTASSSSTSNSLMDLDDFYYLLAAQLKYQDADNPMDTSEMMGTLVQTQMIQAISSMTQTNTTSYAASLVGKQVTIAETDTSGVYSGEVKGTVTGVVLGDNPLVLVDGKYYYLNQVMAVGDVSAETETDAADTTDTGDSSTGSDDTSADDTTATTV